MNIQHSMTGAYACLLTMLIAAPLPAVAWEVLVNEEPLAVMRRDYQGSSLDEIRGTTRLKASLNAVMALLKDAAFNHHWVYRSGGARVLAEKGYARAYVYGIVDAPWPISDRDTVVRFDYQQDPVTREIHIAITNFPGFIPAEKGLVRVPDFGGFWNLRPLAGGWVEVVYQVYGDPGGYIPVWAANRAAVASVTRTLQNMQSAVLRYQGARSDFVMELAAPAS